MKEFDVEDVAEGFHSNERMTSIFGTEMAVICHPNNGYKVRIDVWEQDHGFMDGDTIFENNQNPAHATVLLPGTKKPTKKDVLAKLNITYPEPPNTLNELDERLFEIDSRLTSVHRKSILKWCNANDDKEDKSNWKSARSTWRKLHPDSKPPKNKKQPKRKG